MSEQERGDSGEFARTVSDNDVLKTFEFADDPFLTAGEVAEELPISRSAINARLHRMCEDGLVECKQTGARSVGWWATVAPAPSAETRRDIETTEGELDAGETTSHAEMKRRLGIDD